MPPAGARNYWKSHKFTQLAEDAIAIAIRYADNLPTPQCEIFLGLLGSRAGTMRPAEVPNAMLTILTSPACRRKFNLLVN
jgi:hypothetical protein